MCAAGDSPIKRPVSCTENRFGNRPNSFSSHSELLIFGHVSSNDFLAAACAACAATCCLSRHAEPPFHPSPSNPSLFPSLARRQRGSGAGSPHPSSSPKRRVGRRIFDNSPCVLGGAMCRHLIGIGDFMRWAERRGQGFHTSSAAVPVASLFAIECPPSASLCEVPLIVKLLIRASIS